MKRKSIDKDIELCKHIISMVEEGRLNGFYAVIFKNNLFSSHYAKNIVDSLGVEFIGKDECLKIKNILETIE